VDVMATATTTSHTTFIAPPPRFPCDAVKLIGAG
jgi:hypothetical protein